MYNYCIIHDKEMMSTCCGCGELSTEDGVMEGYCGHCHDHAEFECWDCVDEQEEAAQMRDATEEYWLGPYIAACPRCNMTESEEILREENRECV